jgi:hypothetical protein
MNRVINVDVCRVSRNDGLWIDLIFSIPIGYKCTNIQVDPVFYSPSYQDADAVDFEIDTAKIVGGEECVIQIPVDSTWGVDINTYGIYKVYITAEAEDWAHTELLDEELILKEELTISDVEFVYYCMLPALSKLCDKCAPLPDTLIQQYLMLWGH